MAAEDSSGSGKIVIAHRGASGYLPEHTIEAYTMAYAQGADYVEPDLVRTKDGRFICLHDIDLGSTTDVSEVFPERKREDGHWYAADFTLEEIKRLRAFSRGRSRFPREMGTFRLPTFEAMIELVQGLNKTTGRNVGIYPELKHPAWHRAEGLPLEEAFLEILERYGYKGKDARIFVQCFEAETLEKLRLELGCDVPQILLIGGSDVTIPELQPEGLDAVAAYAEGIGPAKTLIELRPEIVADAHARGLAVHPYSFLSESVPRAYEDLEAELRQFYLEYDVDGLFTDYPDRAVAVLAKPTKTANK